MSGECRADALDEVLDRLRAVHRGRRVVRIVEEDEPGALDRRGHAVEIEPEGRVDLDLDHRHGRAAWRCPVQFSNVGVAVTSALAGDVNARTALFRISCEPGAEDDVGRLDAELRGDGRAQRALGRRAVERIAAGLGKLPHDRVDRRLAGTERVLVAADPDRLHARRQHRPGPAGGWRLRRLRLIVLVPASREPQGRIGKDSGRPPARTSRKPRRDWSIASLLGKTGVGILRSGPGGVNVPKCPGPTFLSARTPALSRYNSRRYV